jgi:two-component system, OmpR family, sensor histidine kinase SenX3
VDLNELVLATISAVLTAAVIVLLVLLRRSTGRDASPRFLGDRSERRSPMREEILERMSEGVLVLDEGMSPILANAAARTLLGLDQASFSGRMISEEVLAVGRRAAGARAEASDTVQVWWPRRGHLSVRATPLRDNSVVVVIQDITEELRIQRMRREFVTHASHELKSPVAGLQTLAEAVRQAVDDDPEAADRFSERLVLEAERLGRLVGDLLDLSRLEDPEHITKETVDLSRVALQELRAIREPADSKSIELSSAIAPGVSVEGDQQQMSLMLRNLLDNAVRYTPRGGRIGLDVRLEGGQALVRVTDSGIGIPHEAQPRVFERFYRVDRARSRDKGGTGLGLAIVKHAVETHGGHIDLVSELERGSTFTVTLPATSLGSVQMRSAAG